jgi:hypothetical protein
MYEILLEIQSFLHHMMEVIATEDLYHGIHYNFEITVQIISFDEELQLAEG